MILALPGCHTSHYWHPPRPPIEELMQEAILESAVKRSQQQAITATATAHEDHPVFVSDRSDERTAAIELAQFEAPATDLRQPESLPAPLLSAAQGETQQHGPAANKQTPSPRLNEEFFETDIREAISILAAEVGADVILDDNVRGVVNTSIVNATFAEALDKLLLPLGFVVGRRGEQYVVCEPDPESPLFPYVSANMEYRPQHLNAEDLLEAPPVQMRRFVRVVDQANTLVIEAPTQFAGVILDRIRSLDQPVPQVELEAIVCVVEPDSGFRFGLDWDHAVSLNGDSAFSAGVSGLSLAGQVSGQGLKQIFSDFSTTSALVQLLAENGYLTIRASPRVIAQNGEKANIKIGRETYFALQPPGGGANSAVFFQQEIEKVESGIELEITPRVRDRDVTIQIAKAEVSEDIRTTTAAISSNPFPIINRRSVSTTVHVEDGKTIIIGGLVQRETIDRVNRVPGLSRLPGVGYLFKSVEHQDREAEVVIFISPRIVRPATHEPVPPP